MRCEFGNTSRISFANCLSRLDGSRAVVMRTLGSVSPARAYSSSMCVRCSSCASSSSASSSRMASACAVSSVGMALPSCSASLMRRFRS